MSSNYNNLFFCTKVFFKFVPFVDSNILQLIQINRFKFRKLSNYLTRLFFKNATLLEITSKLVSLSVSSIRNQW